MDNKPLLAILYEQSTRNIFGKYVRVGPKQYARFTKAEKQLRAQNVIFDDYATRLMDGIRWWVKSNKMTHVPINVFIGQWAQKYYLQNIGNRHYEKIDATQESIQILVQEHIRFMTLLISSSGDVDSAMDMMGESWLSSSKRVHNVIEEEAFALWTAMYGVTIEDYKDLEQYYAR